jgi:iron complex outermembrane receptor protein
MRRKMTRELKHIAVWLIPFFVCAPAGAQQSGQMPAPALNAASMNIEDLMDVHVISVSKQDQKMSQVAAAVFVIGQEDIRRSGASNIPDLLRMVPGLVVAQINANTWAISARGFNSQFANKLLVLVDGRAVYTPTFAQVFWDALDVPLEDIDRIEVIRGPGGTVWGSNAVNGVINIITKKAQNTLGTLVTGGGGTLEQGFGTAQYGRTTKAGAAYRIFATYHNRNHFPDLNGEDGEDGSHLLHGGFRIDSELSKSDALTLQGDIYTGSEGESIIHSVLSPPENLTVFRRGDLSGGNVLSRWNHSFSRRSDFTLQFYFDRYSRSGPQSSEDRNTIDFDFRHHIDLGSRNDLNWGAGYRYSENHTVGTIDLAFIPDSQAGNLFNLFVADQITLIPDRLHIYVGAKLENSYFTGIDFAPSVRLAWTPTTRQTFWAAASNAQRAPSQRDVSLNAALAALPGPAEVAVLGNPEFHNEVVWAYELGYRTQVNKWFSADLATFLNDYRDLQTIEPLPSFFEPNSSPPLLIIPNTFANNMHGATGGLEVSMHWKISDRWTLSPGYSFLKMHLYTDPASMDTTNAADAEGSSPSHQAQLLSHMELPHGIGWDSGAYFVGSLPAQFVRSYTRVDSQLIWRLSEGMQLSIVGQNLLQDHHVEFNDYLSAVNPSQMKRSAYAKMTWKF